VIIKPGLAVFGSVELFLDGNTGLSSGLLTGGKFVKEGLFSVSFSGIFITGLIIGLFLVGLKPLVGEGVGAALLEALLEEVLTTIVIVKVCEAVVAAL